VAEAPEPAMQAAVCQDAAEVAEAHEEQKMLF
jgi:hypothetical protein